MRIAPLKPGMETPLRDLGRAAELLFGADEPGVCKDARSLFRRLVPDVTRNPHLLEEVPRLAVSLLERLDRLAPDYAQERKAMAAAWSEVGEASKK